MKKKKILYVRSGPYKVDITGYNLQEVGLGKALNKIGYDVDILYYSDKNRVEILEDGDSKLRVIWSKGIKIFRSGIYPKILSKEYLRNYDYIIVSEYSQIMAVLLSKLHNQVYIYNGPYYNLFKIKYMEKLYDMIFVKVLNKRIKKIFCKTNRAEEYLSHKGFNNTEVIGVGLDFTKFNERIIIDNKTKKVLKMMSGHKSILYVGSISKRKNVALIIKAFISMLESDKNKDNKQLVLIGKGKKQYTQYCRNLVPKEYIKNILWVEKIDNAQLKYIYDAANIFTLASKQEIFGMVLLEAMYFQLPIVASYTAGSETLIDNAKNGFIIRENDPRIWGEKYRYLLEHSELSKKIGIAARETILEEFNWDRIAEKIVKNLEK